MTVEMDQSNLRLVEAMRRDPRLLDVEREFSRIAAAAAKLSPAGPGKLRAPLEAINLFGPPESGRTLLALFLSGHLEGRGKAPAIIVSDELRARLAAEEVEAFTGIAPLILRPIPLGLSSAAAQSREEELLRLAMLENLAAERENCESGAVVIIPAQTLMERFPRFSDFRENSIFFKRGETFKFHELPERLSDIGYERARQVETAGQFAVRGDLIDIGLASAFVQNETIGLRLSFFDDELDDLRLFDTETQRSLESLEEIRVPQARLILIHPERRIGLATAILREAETAAKKLLNEEKGRELADRLRRIAAADADRLRGGILSGSWERWLSLIDPDRESVLDWLENLGRPLFIDEILHSRSRLDAAQADFQQQIQALLMRGEITAGAADSRNPVAEVMRRLDRYSPKAAIAQMKSSGNGLPGSSDYTLMIQPQESFRGRTEQLLQKLQQAQKEHATVLLLSGNEARKERLREHLNEASLTFPISSRKLGQGLVWPAAKLSIIGDGNIFGNERLKKRKGKIKSRSIDFFSDLRPGELVVHEAHGIGRYLGLETLETSGTKRDYLKVAYAAEDFLYIPIEALDQIQKYLASEGTNPKLSRMGGTEWQRQKQKARDSIRKLATDLVALYAKRRSLKGHAFAEDTVWQRDFEDSFPFEETPDQLTALTEIKEDMESTKVMDRLLCGDVGFGKTELAFRAMFKAVMDGRQAALLAPTTVLAQQHYDSLKQRLGDFPVRIGHISRFVAPEVQKSHLKRLAQGDLDILVGTHRLLSKDIRFNRLGLLVVDEEQRFGVDHKEMLKNRYPEVDVLSMSATPIPRTLHMSLSGIRDISTLTEGPEERMPVQTYVLEYDPAILCEAILRELGRGGQVFYLFNNTHKIASKAAELAELLPGTRVAFAHGRMSDDRLEDVISEFVAGEQDILVCTTIIENGIDISNANTIIVEDADRLGLAQLYQIRGRVGRSSRQAYAYISYRPDKVLNPDAEKRLAAIRDFTELGSGFKIALRDLEVRGAGNLLGGEQHGQMAAIGYELYCRMLDEVIAETRGEIKEEPMTDCLIELAVESRIPSAYIPDEGERMDAYRRIGAITDFDSYSDTLDELIDRYGDPPPAVLSLLQISFTRVMAMRCGITRIRQRDSDLVMHLEEGKPARMEQLSHLFQNEHFKGRLLLDGGAKAHLVFRKAAIKPENAPELLQQLFAALK